MMTSTIPACLEPLLEDWLRAICVLVHALIAFHAIAMLLADSLAALKVKPLMARQSGHVTVASKSKYHWSCRLSIFLTCLGAAAFATGPAATGSVCFEKETAVWPCQMPLVVNSGVQLCYVVSIIANSNHHPTSFRMAVYGAISSTMLVALRATEFVAQAHTSTQGARWQLQQIAGLLLQATGFLLHPRSPDTFTSGKPDARLATAHLLDLLTFSWENNLFRSMRDTSISKDSLPPISPSLETGHLMKCISDYQPDQQLWAWLLRAYYPQILKEWTLAAIKAVFQVVPQYALFYLLRTLEVKTSGRDITLCSLLYGLSLVTEVWAKELVVWFTMAYFQIPLQAVLSSAVYRKTLKLPNFSEGHSNEKKPKQSSCKDDLLSQSIDNHLQLDTGKVSAICSQNVLIPQSFIKLVFTAVALAQLIGWQAITMVIICMIVTTAINFKISAMYSKAYYGTMKYRDQRSNLLSEALRGIRDIRLGVFESIWEKRLLNVRQEEMDQMQRSSLTMCIVVVLAKVGPLVLGTLPIALYAYQSESLTASIAFSSMGLLQRLQADLAALPLLWSYLLECWASCERLEGFLKLPEKQEAIIPSASVVFDNVTVSWSSKAAGEEASSAFCLKQMSLRFPRGKLSIISGGTGSGKNLVLSAILGEADVVSGSIHAPRSTNSTTVQQTAAPIAVVSQPIWLERATIKDNILFGCSYDSERYSKVVAACALEKDIQNLPNADATDVGPTGTSLSGGQRWRVSLARALYSAADTILMGDIMSAIDSSIRKHVLEQALFGEIARDRTLIIATHHLALCQPVASYVVHLSDGHALCTELERQEVGTASSQAPIALEDSKVQHVSGAESTSEKEKDSTEYRPVPPNTIMFGKKSTLAGLAEYLRRGGISGWLFSITITLLSEATTHSGAWWLKQWTDRLAVENENTAHIEHKAPAPSSPDMYYIVVYILVSLASAFMVGFKSFARYNVSHKASLNISRGMICSILRAPLQWIETYPRGEILKRFTSDLLVIDMRIAANIVGELEFVTRVLLAIIAGISVSPYTCICAIGLIAAYWRLAKRSMPIAQQLQQLNSTQLSPLYSQLHSTLSSNGLLVIRAFGRSADYVHRMDAAIDDSSRAAWYNCLYSRWMELQIGLLGVAFEAMIALGAASGHINPGSAGFALIVSRQFSGSVGFLIKKAVVIQNDVNAANRIAEYDELPSDFKAGREAPENWPDRGEVAVENFSTGYSDLPTVLNKIDFIAKSHQRVGLVGRTGAGKSSLFLALCRVLESRQGRILIDGIDISGLSLADLRQQMFIIPQDPFLFSGTLRSNLNLSGNHSDEILVEALDKVRLGLSLDMDLAPGGTNISQGQRQLVCLARAIVSKPKILLLDEATSAVDEAADDILQQILKTTFSKCTVIVIAHRLSTVIDFDNLLVLDRGRVVESGRPIDLSRQSGPFRELLEHSVDRLELLQRLESN